MEMTFKFEIGQAVTRIGSGSYNGRRGVIEQRVIKLIGCSYRVRWQFEKSGVPINWPSGYRTWMQERYLQAYVPH